MPILNAKARKQYHRKWYQSRRSAWFDAKGGRCATCGRSDTLEIHHIDPSQKISHRVWSWSNERREAELAKCEVLCRRCHHIKHRSPQSKIRTIFFAPSTDRSTDRPIILQDLLVRAAAK